MCPTVKSVATSSEKQRRHLLPVGVQGRAEDVVAKGCSHLLSLARLAFLISSPKLALYHSELLANDCSLV